jgi:hypothetical protein
MRGQIFGIVCYAALTLTTTARAECPLGMLPYHDPVAGAVCRNIRTGYTTTGLDATGHCPLGFHIETLKGDQPYCVSIEHQHARKEPVAMPSGNCYDAGNYNSYCR